MRIQLSDPNIEFEERKAQYHIQKHNSKEKVKKQKNGENEEVK